MILQVGNKIYTCALEEERCCPNKCPMGDEHRKAAARVSLKRPFIHHLAGTVKHVGEKKYKWFPPELLSMPKSKTTFPVSSIWDKMKGSWLLLCVILLPNVGSGGKTGIRRVPRSSAFNVSCQNKLPIIVVMKAWNTAFLQFEKVSSSELTLLVLNICLFASALAMLKVSKARDMAECSWRSLAKVALLPITQVLHLGFCWQSGLSFDITQNTPVYGCTFELMPCNKIQQNEHEKYAFEPIRAEIANTPQCNECNLRKTCACTSVSIVDRSPNILRNVWRKICEAKQKT